MKINKTKIERVRNLLKRDVEVLTDKAEQDIGEAWVRFYHRNLELAVRATQKPWVGRVHNTQRQNPVKAIRGRFGVPVRTVVEDTASSDA